MKFAALHVINDWGSSQIRLITNKLSTTMAVLTTTTKQTPYPFAATGIAGYGGRTEIVFDDTAPSISFTVDGNTIDDEEAIVHAIAKEANIPDDQDKVLQLSL